MSSAITKVDHAILFVRDLEAAATRYRRLGFTLTPRYTHPGRRQQPQHRVRAGLCGALAADRAERKKPRFRERDRNGGN
jgi:catechol 2,3-dioxygenase-like lactoylglutathione lyase family enzyme